jgi:hypothetical protein
MSGLMASSAAILPSKNIANGLSGSANPVKIARFSDRSPNHARREGWLGYRAVKADRLPGRLPASEQAAGEARLATSPSTGFPGRPSQECALEIHLF